MKYGYFDDENKEYVITRADTPTPWCNYLGSPEYGAIISNNAAGYSFVKSGAMGRILRFRFNEPINDLPGRNIYIRDCDTSDYWSASWQPVAKDFNSYIMILRTAKQGQNKGQQFWGCSNYPKCKNTLY